MRDRRAHKAREHVMHEGREAQPHVGVKGMGV